MMPISNQQKSGRITIKANDAVNIPFFGSFVAILTNNTTVDVLVSMDDGMESPLRAGAGIKAVRLTDDRRSLIPAVFNRVTFRNTLSVAMTIEYMVSLGESTIPVVINDTVRVEGDGVPVGRDPVAAVVGGIACEISAAAKSISIQPTTNGVIIEVGGKVVARIGEGDFMTFGWSNVSLTLKGDGGTSTVYVTEVQ